MASAIGTAIIGLIFERGFMSRVYGQDVLMQLLVCYAFVLIFDDVVRMIWGPEFKSMGMPSAFQVAPLFIAGGVVPPYYLLLIGVALAAALGPSTRNVVIALDAETAVVCRHATIVPPPPPSCS